MPFVLQQSSPGSHAFPFYVGASTDEKPGPHLTGWSDPISATLLELDTRREFVWRGGQWHFFRGPAVADELGAKLDAILAELQKLSGGLAAYLGTEFPGTD